MTQGRRTFLVSFISLMIGAHLLAIAVKFDDWPLSYYGMFSTIARRDAGFPLLYGVTAEGHEVVLPLHSHFAPFNRTMLGNSLRKLDQAARRTRKKRNPQQVTPAIESLLALYELNRERGRHAGPEIVAMRLYRCKFQLDPQLANLEAPEHREFVCEVTSTRTSIGR
jgi:hypothetical protein